MHQHTGGNAANAKGLGELLFVIGVDLDQLEAAAVIHLEFSNTGPSDLQGPHHGAQKSTNTGSCVEAWMHFGFKICNGHINHGAVSKGNKIYFLLTAKLTRSSRCYSL
jgi:hypothetical protein